jgi:transposase
MWIPRVRVCRPVKEQLKHKNIVKQIKAGQSVRNTAKITGKGASTVQRVKATMAARRGDSPSAAGRNGNTGDRPEDEGERLKGAL